MKRILLPTDFSENASLAIEYAITLFQNEKCEFTLLNAFEVPKSHTVNVIMYNDLMREKSNKGLSKSKHNILDKNILKEGHTIKTISVLGNPSNVICRKAKEEKIDLVCMGKRGENSFYQSQIGGNSKNVISKVECPVMLIPNNNIQINPKHILMVSFCNDKLDTSVLIAIKEIVKRNYPLLEILHISENETQKDILEKNISSEFKNIDINSKVILSHKYEDEIEKIVGRKKIDMLSIPNGNTCLSDQFFKPTKKIKEYTYPDLPYLFLNSKLSGYSTTIQ